VGSSVDDAKAMKTQIKFSQMNAIKPNRLFLLTLCMGLVSAALAGQPDGAALQFWSGKYPSDKDSSQRSLFKREPLQSAIQTLLPKAEIKTLRQLTVESKVQERGGYLVAHVCRPHNCPADAAMVVTQPATGLVWVGLFTREEQRVSTRWYTPNQEGASLPIDLVDEFNHRH